MGIRVKTGDMGWPAPLGKVSPGGGFATLSVPLTQNIQPVNNDGVTPDNQFNGIFIQADPDNTGSAIYVCSNAQAPDTVNFSNVLWKLTPGATYPRSKEWTNTRDLSKIFIGAVNATDGAIVSIDQV